MEKIVEVEYPVEKYVEVPYEVEVSVTDPREKVRSKIFYDTATRVIMLTNFF